MTKSKIWWMNPIYIIIFIHLPILTTAYYLEPKWYKFTASQLKFIDTQYYFFGIVGFLFLITGIKTTQFIRLGKCDASNMLNTRRLDLIFNGMLYLYIAANIILFYEFIKNPSYFIMIANAELEQGYGRELAQTIPGITTLSQLGICLSIICSYKISLNIEKNRYIKLMFLIVFISLIRAFVRSERLALIEVLVVFSLPFCLYNQKFKKIIKLIPIIAVPGLVLIFSISEYFRSWIHYYNKRYDYFSEFIFDRFSSYFMIAQNSAVSYLKYIEINDYPWLTNQWLFKFPGLGYLNDLYRSEYDKYMSFLRIHLDPQYNNYAPIYAIYTDFGILFGCFILFILGLLTGHFHRTFQEQNGIGTFIYPAWFIGVLELSRTYSWGSSRFFIVFVTFFIIYLFCIDRRKV